MATIEVQPIVLTDVSLLIPTDDYAKNVSSVTLTPTSSTVTWNGLGKNSFTGASIATWAASIEYAQDWETANSLSQYLFAHEGEKVEMTFKPQTGSGPSFTVEVTIVPGAIGGAVNAVAVASVTLPCSAKPELVPAG
ncbi:hypothetical protein [Cellulosimicrobium cellulans]|uniref:hypothetical protein n=1 Tax=Cellulosimicrobium cellulans TaxID=1710 RepID=UPI001BAD982A|nr:hypothetical protein [Cellulosimicrobium cellulans]QUC01103.1 hypothetical protein J5A69_08015 [Cellulosimicrobium cellulans]